MTEYERQDPVDRDVAADERSPEEIELEIMRTRERMSNNIDALGEKLSPDNLKQQAKDALAERAQGVVTNVGDQARETGSRVIDFITQNPLPVAAVTLGAIWLFSLRRGSRSEVSGDQMARFAYTGPERRQPDGRPSLGRRLTDRMESAGHAVSEKASHAGERAGELKDRVQERAGEFRTRTRERVREARGGLEHTLQDNPLALMAGAAVIGLALGMLLPETERERRVMGPARDELADRVSNVASTVKETVREEVDARGPELKSTLKDAAQQVKEQVKESASRVAQETKQEVKSEARPK